MEKLTDLLHQLVGWNKFASEVERDGMHELVDAVGAELADLGAVLDLHRKQAAATPAASPQAPYPPGTALPGAQAPPAPPGVTVADPPAGAAEGTTAPVAGG